MSNVNKSKKYAQLLKVGKTLFWKHGIRRVSVEEICEEAQVSKMTFYRLFKNKHALAKAVLEEESNLSNDRYREMMEKDAPYEDKIRELIQLKYEGTHEISQEFIRELLKVEDPELKEFMAKRQAEGMKLFIDGLLEAQKKGEVRAGVNSQFVLYFLAKIQEMVIDPYVLTVFKDEQEAIMEITKLFFYGIIERK